MSIAYPVFLRHTQEYMHTRSYFSTTHPFILSQEIIWNFRLGRLALWPRPRLRDLGAPHCFREMGWCSVRVGGRWSCTCEGGEISGPGNWGFLMLLRRSSLLLVYRNYRCCKKLLAQKRRDQFRHSVLIYFVSIYDGSFFENKYC